MSTPTQSRGDLFVRAFATLAILGPILLVMIAGVLPEGLGRSQLILFGDGGIVAALAAALVLRAGFQQGFQIGSRKPELFRDRLSA
jgi:hypothetical protein